MNTLMLSIAGIVIAVLCALFAVPYFIDWNSYRSVFEAQASRLVGREVRVGGNVNLRLLPVPMMSFENVRIANDTGRFDRPFLKMDSYTVWLSIPPLLKGELEARRMELGRPRLRLAINKTGGGNWEGLGGGALGLPFMPRDVALRSVLVSDGSVALHAPSGRVLLELGNLNGEFQAGTLSGPYRFRGAFGRGDDRRELRFSTGRLTDAKSLKLKASIHSTDARPLLVLDGQLGHDGERLRFAGGVTGRLQMPFAPIDGVADVAGGDGDRTVELKATVLADTTRLRVDSLAFTFESGGHPQLINGEADASWLDELKASARLKARWLDFDNLAKSGAKPGAEAGAKAASGATAAPGQVAEMGARLLQAMMPKEMALRLAIEVEQANVGGGLVKNVGLRAHRKGADIILDQFTVRMPGASRIELSGRLFESQAQRLGFQGHFRLRGSNLGRFAKWALREHVLAEEDIEKFFSLRGKLTIDDQLTAIEEATGELGETAFRGTLERNGRDKGRWQVRFDADRLDLAHVVDSDLKLAQIFERLAQSGTESARQSEARGNIGQDFLSDLLSGKARMRLDLRVGTLLLADQVLRDVAGNLEIVENHLVLDRARLRGDNGLLFEAEGRVDNLNSGPRGEVRYLLEADNRNSARALLRFLGLERKSVVFEPLSTAMVPARVAGVLAFGRRGGDTVDLTVDGLLGGSRTVIEARSDGGLAGLRDNPLDIVAAIENDDERTLLAQLFGDRTPQAGARSPEAMPSGNGATGVNGERIAPARLSIRLQGVPSQGMRSLVALETASLSGTFDGALRLANGTLGVPQAQVSLKARRARDGLALIGLGAAYSESDGPLTIAGRLRYENGSGELQDVTFTTGGATFEGRLAFDARGPVTDVALDGTLDRATLNALMAPLLGPRPDATLLVNAASRAIEETRASDAPLEPAIRVGTLLSERPFDLSLLDSIRGKAHLEIGELALTDGVALERAAIDVALGTRQIALNRLEAQALDGAFRASGSLAREKAGVGLRLEVDWRNINLAKLADEGRRGARPTDVDDGNGPGDERARARGKAREQSRGIANLKLSLAGRGLGPRGLAAVLAGRGTLETKGAVIAGLSPRALAETEAVVVNAGEDAEFGTDDLVRLLKERLDDGRLVIGSRKIPLEVRDGILRTGRVVIDDKAGARFAVATTLELTSFELNSSWVLQQMGKGEQALPPVTIRYKGNVFDLAALEPQIEAGALQRELVVRKMEADVARLERLRQLEEARERAREAEKARLRPEKRPEKPEPAGAEVPPAAAGDGAIGATGATGANGGDLNGPDQPAQDSRPDEEASVPAPEVIVTLPLPEIPEESVPEGAQARGEKPIPLPLPGIRPKPRLDPHAIGAANDQRPRATRQRNKTASEEEDWRSVLIPQSSSNAAPAAKTSARRKVRKRPRRVRRSRPPRRLKRQPSRSINLFPSADR